MDDSKKAPDKIPRASAHKFQENENKSNSTSIFMRCIHVFFHSFFSQVVGPKLMENRKPFNLRYTLILYNFIQVIFSAWLFYEVSAVPQLPILQFNFCIFLDHLLVITPISPDPPPFSYLFCCFLFSLYFTWLFSFIFVLFRFVCAFLRIKTFYSRCSSRHSALDSNTPQEQNKIDL